MFCFGALSFIAQVATASQITDQLIPLLLSEITFACTITRSPNRLFALLPCLSGKNNESKVIITRQECIELVPSQRKKIVAQIASATFALYDKSNFSAFFDP